MIHLRSRRSSRYVLLWSCHQDSSLRLLLSTVRAVTDNEKKYNIPVVAPQRVSVCEQHLLYPQLPLLRAASRRFPTTADRRRLRDVISCRLHHTVSLLSHTHPRGASR